MPLSSKISLAVTGQQTSVLDLGTAAFPLALAWSTILASGVGAGQADRLFTDTRTIAASGTDDIDLAGDATFKDAFGVAMSFVKVKGLFIRAAAANANNVVVGAAATNGFIAWVGAATHTLTVRPGAVLALFAGSSDTVGYAVTAATADILRVANGGAGTSVTYDIAILGTSA
jgi:hypothetical protein